MKADCTIACLAIALLIMCCNTRNEEPGYMEKPSERDGNASAVITPSNPVRIGERGTWRFDIVIGEGGIPNGGGIILQVSPWWGWSPPQSEIATAPGFCTAQSSNGNVKLEAGGDPSRYYLLVKVFGGYLDQGDTVTIVYGDTNGGMNPGASATADRYAERFQEFLIKTDGDGDGVFGEIDTQPGLAILPRNASQLCVNAPSIIRPGIPFEVSVAALDVAGNLALDYAGTLSVHTDSDVSIPSKIILDSRHAGARRFWVICERPGIFSIRLQEPRRRLYAESNPFLCGDGNMFDRVYWGDIHGHTSLSDGTGDPGDYYRYARDGSGLDVAAITDHAALGFRQLKGKPWRKIVEAAETFLEPGRFITILGYEWTSWTYGHRNVYFPGLRGEPISPYEPGADTPKGLFRLLEEYEPMTIPHHVAGGPIAVDWKNTPRHPSERLTEVFSVHGNCEYYGCPGMIYHAQAGHFVQDVLVRGRRLGLLASGDGHIGHPGRSIPSYQQGLVGFIADELTREAIWEALYERRVYGTTGARILLNFRINEYPIGSEIPDDEMNVPRHCTINVFGTDPITSVALLKNNTVIAEAFGSSMFETLEFTDNDPAHCGDFYYIRIMQRDGHQAWAGPIWLGAE